MLLVVKNPLANAGNLRDSGSIPGKGRSHAGRNGKELQYPCLKIPWTEEPGGLHARLKLQTCPLKSLDLINSNQLHIH